MPQIFHRRSNTIARVSIIGVVVLIILSGWGLYASFWSPYMTKVNVPIEQPVPFSHEHHYGGLGIDCRYCHTSVETSSFAGIPPTETCMTCHSQLYTDQPILAPVRQSLATDTPMQWKRVNDVPDFVFFNHSIHINKGIGCSTCHGPVQKMPLMWKANTLYMKWCLDCHRDPAKFIRPREEVFNMNWIPPVDQRAEGRKLVKDYHVNARQLTDCSMCHR
jgi:Cytochrome c7 and related cytochrome c